MLTPFIVSIFIGIILKIGYLCLVFKCINVFNLKFLDFLCFIISSFLSYILKFIFYLLDIIKKVNFWNFSFCTPNFIFVCLYYILIVFFVFKFNLNVYVNYRNIKILFLGKKKLKRIKTISLEKIRKKIIKVICVLILFTLLINILSKFINKRL